MLLRSIDDSSHAATASSLRAVSLPMFAKSTRGSSRECVVAFSAEPKIYQSTSTVVRLLKWWEDYAHFFAILFQQVERPVLMLPNTTDDAVQEPATMCIGGFDQEADTRAETLHRGRLTGTCCFLVEKLKSPKRKVGRGRVTY